MNLAVPPALGLSQTLVFRFFLAKSIPLLHYGGLIITPDNRTLNRIRSPRLVASDKIAERIVREIGKLDP